MDIDTVITNENKHEYVKQLIERMYVNPVQRQMVQIRRGLCDILGKEKLSKYTVVDLKRRLGGQARISASEWKKWTYYATKGYTKRDIEVAWFWHTVENLEKDELHQLFQIVFGFNRLPFVGFKGLLPYGFVLIKAKEVEGMDVDTQLPTMEAQDRKSPIAWNLCIPPYTSQDIFDKQIRAFIKMNKQA